MATIAENIQTLRSIKSDIKNAIIQKGGSVTDAFGTYAQAITNLPSGGGGGTEIEDALVMRELSVYSNDRVSRVGEYTFANCSSLISVSLPNCKSVDSCAFISCMKLRNANLSLCIFLGDSAFTSCSSLISINLPNCISIGSNIFGYCSNLMSVNLPSCTYATDFTFYKCSKLPYIDLPNCSHVGDYTFFLCPKLSSIDLPKCTMIDNYAFYGCSALAYIDLPLCTILGGYNVFDGCSALTYIDLPNCKSIGGGAFNSCTNLAQVYLSSVTSVTTIQSNTFSNCPNLTSVYVPSSLVNAFKTAQYWSSISDKIVAYREPTEPTKYPPLVYSAKSAGSTITVNGETVTLEQGDNITLDYPNEITSVEAKENEALTYLQIPNTVTSINDQAFEFCIGLKSVNIPSGVTSIMGTFNACSALTSVTLPDTLQTIGSSTFMECTSLTSITIPSSVTMIDSCAFDYCESLTDFNFNGTMEQWSSITLADDWKNNAAFTVVHCTDGDVNIL